MAKAPSFQFYPGDWMKDPSLSMCAPATRGIWADILCVIHELNQGGTAVGSAEQFARACRCTSIEFVAAADELSSTGTADIEQRNGRYHIHSRRMERDLQVRAAREAAGELGGNAKRDNQSAQKQPSKPPSKTVANAQQGEWQTGPPSSSSSSSSSSSELNTPPPPHARDAWREIPIVQEHPPLADAIAFWLGHWPSVNGGPAGDEIRIETRLAEAIDAGWSAEKIVRSIRFSVNRCAKRWLDPDDDWSQQPRGRNGKRKLSIEDGR